MKTFEDIYAENHARLFRLALRMVDDREGATDMVQEVFLALYEKTRTGATILYLNTWLYRVTLNKCNDWLKKQKRYIPLEEAPDVPAEEAFSERSERDQLVRKVLLGMKPTERALLLLYGEDCTYREISEATGIRLSSVGKTLARSLEKMEDQLKKLSYEMY